MAYPTLGLLTINQRKMLYATGTPLQVEQRAYAEYHQGILTIEQAARRAVKYNDDWVITGKRDNKMRDMALKRMGVVL